MLSPPAHGCDDGFQGFSGWGQGILYFRGDLGVDFSAHEAVAFELAELAGEHSGCDGAQQAAELGKSAKAGMEVIEDQDFPFAADEDDCALRGTPGAWTSGRGASCSGFGPHAVK